MEKQTPSRRRHRVLAVIFLIAFLFSCGITWWLHTPTGETAGFYLEKTRYRLFSPYYLPDPDGDGRSDVIGLRFTDEGDLEKAKKFMPGLLVLGYIPEGWQLDSLELSKTLSGNWYARYYYLNQGDQLISIDEYVGEEKENMRFFQEGEIIRLSNREVYQFVDPVTNNKCIWFYQDNLIVYVRGGMEKYLYDIADNM